MPTLTKRDIIVAISNDTGVVQHEVCNIVERTLDLIVRSLSEGQPVELRNFGVFEVRVSKETTRRNPNDPDNRLNIPPRATVKFKGGKIMRELIEVALAEGRLLETDDAPEPSTTEPETPAASTDPAPPAKPQPVRRLQRREIPKAA